MRCRVQGSNDASDSRADGYSHPSSHSEANPHAYDFRTIADTDSDPAPVADFAPDPGAYHSVPLFSPHAGSDAVLLEHRLPDERQHTGGS